MKKAMFEIKKFFLTGDLVLFALSLACTAYGLLLIYSACLSFGSSRNFTVQIAGALIGMIGMLIISKLDYESMTDMWYVFMGLGIFAIIVTLIFGKGPTAASTNHNWIKFGFINLQPSELVKLAFIITFSASLNKNRERINSIAGLIRVIPHLMLYAGLIYLQGDMGTTIIFLFMGFVMLFVSGLDAKFLIGSVAAVAVAAPIIWTKVLTTYMRDRILFGFNPELDSMGVGYQAVQSKIAIGSGQLLGKGYMKGTQIQNELVPAKQTDFIFAVAGEEFGFVGSVIVILLLLALMARVLQNSFMAKDNVGTLICTGVFAMLFAQVFENLGMCMGFLPVIGITLPFFSYGGSSIMSVWWAIGLVMSVHERRKGTNFILPV